MTALAAGGPAWTGAAAGIAAAVVFVLFSGWIVVERVRRGRADQHTSSVGEGGEGE